MESKLPQVGTTIFTQLSALAAECDAINLAQGFPDFDPPQALREALAWHSRHGNNQYAPMHGVQALRQQIARHLERETGVGFDEDSEVTVVPGATEGLFCAIMAAVRSGDEVILLDPCYDSYEPAVALAGGRAVHVPLRPEDYAVDWPALRAAVTERTRMLVINSPHNPAGSVWTDNDLAQLEELAGAHDLLVLSDEVYAQMVYDGRRHVSVLDSPARRQRSCAGFSFGKTYSVTGWKTGYCVAPEAFTRELRKVHQFVCFVGVTPVQMALADFMREEPAYGDSIRHFCQAKRDLFRGALAQSRFTLKPCAGSYFQLLDYSAITDEADDTLCRRWTRELGVASIPVSGFYREPPRQRVLRFCFAKRDEVLLKAAEILCGI